MNKQITAMKNGKFHLSVVAKILEKKKSVFPQSTFKSNLLKLIVM